MGRIHHPTLVLAGENDLTDFLEIADILSGKILGSKKITIPNAGHMCNMENQDYFNEVVLHFLAGEMDIEINFSPD